MGTKDSGISQWAHFEAGDDGGALHLSLPPGPPSISELHGWNCKRLCADNHRRQHRGQPGSNPLRGRALSDAGAAADSLHSNQYHPGPQHCIS